MDILVPHYLTPGRRLVDGIVPPSPPAERRAERRRIIERELRYPISGRVLLPGMPAYNETMQAAGLVNGGMVNEGHALVDGGVIRAHVSGPAVAVPLAFWRLEEASGTRVDSSGNGFDFSTVVGSGATNGVGKIGNALYLDGASGLSQANATGLNPTGDFSFGGWIYLSGNAGGNGVMAFRKGLFGTLQYGIYVASGGNEPRAWFSNNGSATVLATATALSTATWYLFVGVFTRSNFGIVCSLNGASLGGGSTSSGLNTGTGLLYMGVNDAIWSFWPGRIDAFGFWNVALTNTDITNLYNGGNGTEYFSGTWH